MLMTIIISGGLETSVCFQGDPRTNFISKSLDDAVTIRYEVDTTYPQFSLFFTFWRLKRSAEHRKKVLQRQQVLNEKRSAVQFQDILADDSEGKAVSHYRLVSYVKKFGAASFTKMYTKEQLTRMSSAYGVEVSSRANKTTLSSNLIPVLQSCANIPNPCFVNEYRAEASVDENLQRVVLRISRRN